MACPGFLNFERHDDAQEALDDMRGMEMSSKLICVGRFQKRLEPQSKLICVGRAQKRLERQSKLKRGFQQKQLHDALLSSS